MAIGIVNLSNEASDFSFTAPFSGAGSLNNVPASSLSLSTLSVGYAGDIGWSVPNNQLVTIVSSLDATNTDGVSTIKAIIDKPFSMSSSSDWSTLIGTSKGVDELIQGLSNATISGVSVYSTRRIWTGSEPLSLQLNLKFYAVYNTYSEVLSPCIRLQRLSLPSFTSGGASGVLGLLTPPGPSPYTWNASTPTSVVGDNISIQIGGYLLFDPVIVKRVVCTFDNKYDTNGYPMGADVQIEFQTYQVMTKADISNAIQGPGGPLSQTNTQVSSAPSMISFNQAADLNLSGGNPNGI